MEPERPSSSGTGGDVVPVTIHLPPSLDRQISEKAASLGLTREELLLRAAFENNQAGEDLRAIRSDLGKMAEKNSLLMDQVRQELRGIDEGNRKAYESLEKSLKPSRKEWGLIGGGAAVAALLLAVLLIWGGIGSSRNPPASEQTGKTGAPLPSQMGEKDKYVYFVGRWYLGVRDRMSTKERLFLENYLKPFDNFDEDLKARKAAGL